MKFRIVTFTSKFWLSKFWNSSQNSKIQNSEIHLKILTFSSELWIREFWFLSNNLDFYKFYSKVRIIKKIILRWNLEFCHLSLNFGLHNYYIQVAILRKKVIIWSREKYVVSVEVFVYLSWYFKDIDFVLIQVLLRWAVQQGIPVLPKSSNPERIQKNKEIFDFSLSDADMDRLSALDCGSRFCWDPSEVA